MNPLFRIDFSISDSLKIVRKSVLIYETIIRLAGKQIGQKPGTHLVTKKSIAAKEIIMKHNKSFGGSLNDIETIRQAGITRKTFYKYKKELLSNTVA